HSGVSNDTLADIIGACISYNRQLRCIAVYPPSTLPNDHSEFIFMLQNLRFMRLSSGSTSALGGLMNSMGNSGVVFPASTIRHRLIARHYFQALAGRMARRLSG